MKKLHFPAMTDTIAPRQGARLRAARIAAGFPSARAAAQELGFAESTYAAHERGTRAMSAAAAARYAQRFRAFGVKVTASELLFGAPGAERQKMADLTGTKSDAVPKRGRQARATFLEESLPPDLQTLRRLPVFGRFDAMKGEGRIFMDATAIDHVQGLADLAQVPGAYAVYMPDGTMEPKFEAGTLLYVHPTMPVRRDNYVVVKLREEGASVPVGLVLRFVQRTPSRVVARQLNPPREIDLEAAQVISIERIVGSAEP